MNAVLARPMSGTEIYSDDASETRPAGRSCFQTFFGSAGSGLSSGFGSAPAVAPHNVDDAEKIPRLSTVTRQSTRFVCCIGQKDLRAKPPILLDDSVVANFSCLRQH